MGNCLQCLFGSPDERPYENSDESCEDGVCDRCHRTGHSRKECYADTYADGSLIRKICSKCGMFHNNDWYGSCSGNYY